MDIILRQLGIACAAVCYGIATLFVRKIRDVPQVSMTAFVLLMSVLFIVPASLLKVGHNFLNPSLISIAAMVILGVVHTAMANLMAYNVVQRMGATFFAQLNFMVPLFGVLFAVVFLREHIGINALIALFLILTGVAMP